MRVVELSGAGRAFQATGDELFAQTAQIYVGVPGLVRKYFGYSEDGSTIVGVYLWRSKADANALYSPEWVAGVRSRWGVMPAKSEWYVPQVVESAEGRVITEKAPAMAEAVERPRRAAGGLGSARLLGRRGVLGRLELDRLELVPRRLGVAAVVQEGVGAERDHRQDEQHPDHDPISRLDDRTCARARRSRPPRRGRVPPWTAVKKRDTMNSKRARPGGGGACAGLTIGDVTITSIVERDGPWRRPEDMFPAYDPELGKRHLAELDPVVFDPASGKMVITYQTFVVRTPKHTILVDTCTGEDKGYPAPMDFPKQPWLDGFRAAGLASRTSTTSSARISTSTIAAGTRCCATGAGCRPSRMPNTSSTSANTPPGRRRPGAATNPPGNVWRFNCEPVVAAGQALLVDDDFALDDTISLTPTPGHAPCHCCINIRSGGQRAVVTGDLMHHALQCREPQWSTIFDWDPQAGDRARAGSFFGEVAGTGTLLLPIHFPHPTAGRLESDGERFRYGFVR